jgi:hypothetical protein
MDQLSFASLDYAAKKKRTKRDVFWLRWQPWCLGSRSKLRSGRIIPRLVRAAVGDHSQGGLIVGDVPAHSGRLHAFHAVLAEGRVTARRMPQVPARWRSPTS